MVVSAWCLDTGDNTEEGGEAGLGRKAVCSDYILFCHSSNWPGLGARGVGGEGTVVISGKGFEVKMLV